jgi:pimeloyl-ACP methyl ester carboxylesterase
VKGAAWKTKPSWYIVANQDRTVEPDLQRFFAERIAATTYEIESSHMVMLSHPEFVIDVIKEAAEALQASRATSGVAG